MVQDDFVRASGCPRYCSPRAEGTRSQGTVTLHEDEEDYYLLFENYRQIQGPDVYVYLTPAPNPKTQSDVDAGVRIPLDGGAGGGQSTKQGTFSQRLPENIDPDQYGGVSIWCNPYSVAFGLAALERV